MLSLHVRCAVKLDRYMFGYLRLLVGWASLIMSKHASPFLVPLHQVGVDGLQKASVHESDVPAIGMMLCKGASAVESIVYHSDTREPLPGFAVFGLESVPCKPEHVLVAEEEFVVVSHLLIIEPRSKLEMVPEACLVDEHLAAFLLIFVHATGGIGDCPHGVLWSGPGNIRPENGVVLLVSRRVVKLFRWDYGNIVGVEKKRFGESGVDDGCGFELVVDSERPVLLDVQNVSSVVGSTLYYTEHRLEGYC